MKGWIAGLGMFIAGAVLVSAADWPQWGGTDERNFVSPETGLPHRFSAGSGTNLAAGATFEPPLNIRWKVRLGTQTYPSPVISRGRIVIASNDQGMNHPRVPKSAGGLVLCLEESTGRVLWQLPLPRLRTANKQFNYDDLALGVCSTPTVEGDRAYLVGSRGDVLCLDLKGQADGNDGPFTDEGAYLADHRILPDKPGRFDEALAPPPGPPVEIGEADGDIIWAWDFLRALDVWPQDAVDGSILIVGEHLFVCLSNGVDKSHKNVPSPRAPDVVVLDKRTGKLLAVNEDPIGAGIFHGDWSSPTLCRTGRRELVVWGGGDGICYAFDPRFEPGSDGKPGVLRKVWWFDGNPPHNRLRDGKPLPYNKNHEGPSEFLATPVVYSNRIYIAVGQDSRHGDGPGCFSCIDPSGTGDITESGRVWQSFDVHRAFASAAVTGGLAFVADYAGTFYCLDAASGRELWTHRLGGKVFGSPLAVDGKVYIGDERGRVTVFRSAAEKEVLAENRLDGPIYSTPTTANGILYIATCRYLYALEESR